MQLAHIRELAAGAARFVCRCGGARRAGRLRRRRAALRARLYDGVVPLAHQHARRRLRRLARESRAAAAGSLCRGAPPRRQASLPSAAVSSPTNASPAAATSSDAAYFGVAFARAGMDFLSTSRGGKFDDAKQPAVGAAAYPYTGQSGYECMPQFISDERGPFGRNAEPTAAIRKAVRDAGSAVPVVCTGGIHNFEMAEDYLARGVCDIVGAARQSLADPDWFRKTLARASGPRCGCASTPITARGWTRSTSRSPASSGTSCPSMAANAARPTASAGSPRRLGSRRTSDVKIPSGAQ